jgi:hypothetical protein
MFEYYIFWIFLIIFCYESQGKNKFFRIIAATLFALLLGFRRNVGTDYLNYIDYFKYDQQLAYLEPGYNFINKIVYSCGGDAVWVFLTMAIISSVFIYLALNEKKVIYYPSALLCYILCFPFLTNGVRQGLAVSIFFFSYIFIEQRKLYYFIILTLLSTFFHISALVLLPLYFILRKPLRKRNYVILYLLSFSFIFIKFQSFITPYLKYLGKYALFADSSYFLEGAGLNLGAIFSLTYLCTIFLLSIYTKIYEKESVLFNLFFISIILKNLQINSSIIGRINIYFEWFLFILLPIIVNELRINSNLKFLIILFYIIIFALLIFNSYSPKYDLVPYQFFWTK